MKNFHLCQDIRGALRDWDPALWEDVMRDTETEKMLSPPEVQDYLFDQLAQGHEVIPIGGPCEDFDYSGSGCPGHETTDEKGQE